MIGDYPSPAELLNTPFIAYEAFRRHQLRNWVDWFQRELRRLQAVYPQGLVAGNIPLTQERYQELVGQATKENLARYLQERGNCAVANTTSRQDETPMIAVTKLLYEEPICDLWTQSSKKLWVQGRGLLNHEEGAVAARVYLTVRPEHAFEAFCSVSLALIQNGSIAKVQLCLYFEGMDSTQPQDNPIVIYVHNTAEPQLMNSLLVAINQTRADQPQLFALTQQEYDYLVACRLASYRMEYNAITSIVEQPSTPVLESWDSGTSHTIDDFIGFSQYPLTPNLLELAQRRLTLLQAAISRPMHDRLSANLLRGVMTGESVVNEGEIVDLRRIRSMKCPALVNYERDRRFRSGRQLLPLRFAYQ